MNYRPKEYHLIISIIIFLIVLTLLLVFGIVNICRINPKDLPSTLLTTSGIFVGFIISALGIYYSMPLREEIKRALIQQGYYKQVARNFVISIIAFAMVISLSIVSICIYNENELILLQHIINTCSISIFIFGMILLVLTSINFFKIITKNNNG